MNTSLLDDNRFSMFEKIAILQHAKNDTDRMHTFYAFINHASTIHNHSIPFYIGYTLNTTNNQLTKYKRKATTYDNKDYHSSLSKYLRECRFLCSTKTFLQYYCSSDVATIVQQYCIWYVTTHGVTLINDKVYVMPDVTHVLTPEQKLLLHHSLNKLLPRINTV